MAITVLYPCCLETNERLLSAANGELIIWNASNREVAHFFDNATTIGFCDRLGSLGTHQSDQIFAPLPTTKLSKWQFSRFGGKEKVAVRHVITCNENFSMAMHPTLEQLVAGCADSNIHLYGVHTGASMEPFELQQPPTPCCALSGSRACLRQKYNIPLSMLIFASASHGKTVLWYRDQQRCYRTFSGHTVSFSLLLSARANPNTKRFRVFTGHDATIGIWERRPENC